MAPSFYSLVTLHCLLLRALRVGLGYRGGNHGACPQKLCPITWRYEPITQALWIISSCPELYFKIWNIQISQNASFPLYNHREQAVYDNSVSREKVFIPTIIAELYLMEKFTKKWTVPVVHPSVSVIKILLSCRRYSFIHFNFYFLKQNIYT